VTVEKMSASHSLVEVLDRVLDHGIIIKHREVFMDLLGVPLEMLVLEERAAIISVDSYLRYAEAVVGNSQ
jgi:hypothetical protein